MTLSEVRDRTLKLAGTVCAFAMPVDSTEVVPVKLLPVRVTDAPVVLPGEENEPSVGRTPRLPDVVRRPARALGGDSPGRRRVRDDEVQEVRWIHGVVGDRVAATPPTLTVATSARLKPFRSTVSPACTCSADTFVMTFGPTLNVPLQLDGPPAPDSVVIEIWPVVAPSGTPTTILFAVQLARHRRRRAVEADEAGRSKPEPFTVTEVSTTPLPGDAHANSGRHVEDAGRSRRARSALPTRPSRSRPLLGSWP